MSFDVWEAVLGGDALAANRPTRVEVGGHPALGAEAFRSAGFLERFTADPASFVAITTEA